MNTPDFVIKQGDTVPWDVVLKENGSAVDLTNATTVTLFARRRRGTVNKIDGASVSIITPATGACRFQPSTSDVDEAGLFDTYYLVTWAGGTESRFPTDGSGREYYDTVEITPNLE